MIYYRYAATWNPFPKDHEGGDLRSFMSMLISPDGPYGGRFHYVFPNTDLLAQKFERASGKRYAELMTERLWKPIGAEASGCITVDRLGGPLAAGRKYFLARDLARVGIMMADGGQREGKQVIPAIWSEDNVKNGDANAWRNSDF